MGSSSSALGGGIIHESLCSCSWDSFAIEQVCWASVDLPGRFLWETFRGLAFVATAGASAWVKGGLKEGTHDYVLVKCKCHSCGQNPWIILEFGPNGKEWHIGYYRERNGAKECFNCNRKFTYQMIAQVYQGMPGGGYDLVDRNCGHWAGDMYWRLYNKARQVGGIQ